MRAGHISKSELASCSARACFTDENECMHAHTHTFTFTPVTDHAQLAKGISGPLSAEVVERDGHGWMDGWMDTLVEGL